MNLDVTGDLLITTLPLISLGATYALTAVGIYLGNRYHSNKLVQGMLVLDQVIIDVVKELNQTVVNDLKAAKADGKLTPEEAAQIKTKAVNLVLNRLGVGFVRTIEASLGPIFALVSTKIEAVVFDLKKKVTK